MDTNYVTLLEQDVEFQPDGKALIVKPEANQFLQGILQVFGEIFLVAGSVKGVNINCPNCPGTNTACNPPI